MDMNGRRARTPSLGQLVVSTTLLVLFCYGATYYCLTRRERGRIAEYGIKGVLYVPVDEVIKTKDLTRHYRLAIFFAPANWVDTSFFNGNGPASITFDLN